MLLHSHCLPETIHPLNISPFIGHSLTEHHSPSHSTSDFVQSQCKLVHDMRNEHLSLAVIGLVYKAHPDDCRQCATKVGHVQVVHDEGGRVWLMLRSGSRNIGNITAQNYDKIAQAQLTQQNIKVPGGLNYLEIDSRPGQEYLQVTLLEFVILFLLHVSFVLVFFVHLWLCYPISVVKSIAIMRRDVTLEGHKVDQFGPCSGKPPHGHTTYTHAA